MEAKHVNLNPGKGGTSSQKITDNFFAENTSHIDKKIYINIYTSLAVRKLGQNSAPPGKALASGE